MSPKATTPHDAIVRDTFTQPEHAIGLLSTIVPSDIAEHLDFGRAELGGSHLVDAKLRELETDLLFRVPTVDGGEVVVYVLVEHQSTADRWMSLRLLRYMVRIWDQWHRNDDRAPLPPIVPIVLSHAPGGWKVARGFAELLDGTGELLDALRPHVPAFEAIVEDLVGRSDEELLAARATALGRLVLLLLKHIRDGDLVERLPSWTDAVREVGSTSGPAALVRVLRYIVECVEGVPLDELKWVEHAIGAEDGEVIMTLAEQLEEEGRREGLVAMVVKQIRARFGDLGAARQARLEAATAGQLDLIAERVVTSESVDDVLSVLD